MWSPSLTCKNLLLQHHEPVLNESKFASTRVLYVAAGAVVVDSIGSSPKLYILHKSAFERQEYYLSREEQQHLASKLS